MMRIHDVIKLSTRMFKTRAARTWLTILGIGVGIAAVVVLVGLGYGLQGVLLEKIVFGEALLSLDVSMPGSKVVIIDNERVEQFLNIEHVEDVSPLASFTSLITFGKLTGSISLQGVNHEYFKYAGIVAQEGKLPQKEENNKIVLSSAVLKLFEMEPADIIGKKVRFKVFIEGENSEIQEVPLEKDYEISGVIEDDFSISAFIFLSELSSNFSIPYYEKARVKVESSEYLDVAEEEILNQGFIVKTLSKTVEQANKIFGGIQIMLAIFGGIALMVSAIGMFNTMTVTLLERTNEIGIMRTIGASPRSIKILFLAESIVMGFLGGIVGIAIGVGGGTLINFLLNTLATRMGGASISLFRFPLFFLSFIAIFSGVMGFFTGVFPARRASSLNPLDAIRYK